MVLYPTGYKTIESEEMKCMFKRIFFWMFKKNNCHHCCLLCKFYNICKKDANSANFIVK